MVVWPGCQEGLRWAVLAWRSHADGQRRGVWWRWSSWGWLGTSLHVVPGLLQVVFQHRLVSFRLPHGVAASGKSDCFHGGTVIWHECSRDQGGTSLSFHCVFWALCSFLQYFHILSLSWLPVNITTRLSFLYFLPKIQVYLSHNFQHTALYLILQSLLCVCHPVRMLI